MASSTEQAIELRGPCEHLAVKLDVQRRVIQWKCPWCSKATGTPVYHEFDAETGQMCDQLTGNSVLMVMGRR